MKIDCYNYLFYLFNRPVEYYQGQNNQFILWIHRLIRNSPILNLEHKTKQDNYAKK